MGSSARSWLFKGEGTSSGQTILPDVAPVTIAVFLATENAISYGKMWDDH